MLDEWIHEAGNVHMSECLEHGRVSEITSSTLRRWSWVAEMAGSGEVSGEEDCDPG